MGTLIFVHNYKHSNYKPGYEEITGLLYYFFRKNILCDSFEEIQVRDISSMSSHYFVQSAFELN